MRCRIDQDHGPGRDRTCDLGIKCGCQALLLPRNTGRNAWLSRINSGLFWGCIVDLSLTHPVFRGDNALSLA